jgi:phosphoribosylformylglycinamidine cyclo-ligase
MPRASTTSRAPSWGSWIARRSSTVQRIAEGDVIIGLPSSGLHTNGYSLARKIVFEVGGLSVDEPEMPGLGQHGRRRAASSRTLSYAKLMQIVMKVVDVKGMAHITGGGITENLPRILPEGLAAEIDLGAWKRSAAVPLSSRRPATSKKRKCSAPSTCGQGFLVVVSADREAKTRETIEMTGQKCYTLGRIVKGDKKVHYKGTLNYA